ncbi:MAG TPA: protein phosphatase 2C domain-containing protein [Steroidobacteraceae bacterium]|nr:protein phosphatase 2C domain-containing protein [Steroidobacteraceae bacterium]
MGRSGLPSANALGEGSLFEDTLVEEDVYPVFVSAGATHAGYVRPTNQDAFVESVAGGLWAVADGMGGYRDGDVASRMVCDALSALSMNGSLEDGIDAVRQAMSDVNQRLHDAAVRPINPIVSGSTVAIFLAKRTHCAMAWAGDSRIYRLRQGQLAQLTSDHTWVQELNLQSVDEETQHAITRAVGGEDTLLLDVRRDRVHPGDRYLLCSDGLTREISDQRIAQLLALGTVRESAEVLITATLAAGARDNVTVIVVEVQ